MRKITLSYQHYETDEHQKFRVERVTNSLKYLPGQKYHEADLRFMMEMGFEVTIVDAICHE